MGLELCIDRDAERHAARPFDQRLRLAAAVPVIDLYPPDRDIDAADMRLGKLDIGDDARLVIERDIGIDDRRPQFELRRADRKSTRLNSSHSCASRMPSSV